MEKRSGLIYKLTNDEDDKIYIGSTLFSLKTIKSTLNKRLYIHRYYAEKNKKITSCYYINKYNNINIELIEELEFDDPRELRLREGYHIKNNTNAVNVKVEGRTKKQYYIDNRESILKNLRDKYEADESVREKRKIYNYNQRLKREYLKLNNLDVSSS